MTGKFAPRPARWEAGREGKGDRSGGERKKGPGPVNQRAFAKGVRSKPHAAGMCRRLSHKAVRPAAWS